MIRKMKLPRAILVALSAVMLVSGSVSAASADESDSYYQPYPTPTTQAPPLIPSKNAVSKLGTVSKTSTVTSTKANGELFAEFTPKTRRWVANWVAVDRSYYETRSRQVPTYSWVHIGNGYALDVNGNRADRYTYSHPNISYSAPFIRAFIYAGNNTTSNGYGAHNVYQAHLGGMTYDWLYGNCDGSLIYTPKYDYSDWGAYQAGFWAPSINPYGSGYSGLKARGGVTGGDPLMRWSGDVGYGWYYSCYATNTYRLQHTGWATEYYQVLIPNVVMEDRGKWTDFNEYPSLAGDINLSTLNMFCTATTENAAGVAAGTKVSIGSALSAAPLTGYSVTLKGTSPLKLITTAEKPDVAFGDTVTLKDSTGKVIGSPDRPIPAACYGKTVVSAGSSELNPS